MMCQGNQRMADFQVHRENAGTEDAPNFRVFICLGNGGLSKHGPKAIPSCATFRELEEQIGILVSSLGKAHEIARGMLEEDAGDFDAD